MANIPNLAAIRRRDPELGRALDYLKAIHDNVAQQTNASSEGQTPPPPPHDALKVEAGQGYFRADITANGAAQRGQEHFLEISEDGWKTQQLKHLGAATSWYGQLGAKDLEFRSYSQYPTSAPSEPVYHPVVSGAGGTAPAVTSSQAPLQGYGKVAYPGPTPPKR